jgi:D-alanine-D-alanine ligase-like ATP-grasp enzyme
MTKHVTVLMGGWSAAHEISIVSGAAVAKSLVPEQAVHAGISFQDLVVWMVDNAECDA